MHRPAIPLHRDDDSPQQQLGAALCLTYLRAGTQVQQSTPWAVASEKMRLLLAILVGPICFNCSIATSGQTWGEGGDEGELEGEKASRPPATQFPPADEFLALFLEAHLPNSTVSQEVRSYLHEMLRQRIEYFWQPESASRRVLSGLDGEGGSMGEVEDVRASPPPPAHLQPTEDFMTHYLEAHSMPNLAVYSYMREMLRQRHEQNSAAGVREKRAGARMFPSPMPSEGSFHRELTTSLTECQEEELLLRCGAPPSMPSVSSCNVTCFDLQYLYQSNQCCHDTSNRSVEHTGMTTLISTFVQTCHHVNSLYDANSCSCSAEKQFECVR